MDTTSLVEKLADTIRKAQKGSVSRSLLYSNEEVRGKHEFLFFIKPEITLESDSVQLEKILDMIVQKIADFKLNIKNAILLPAAYLKEYGIIAQHYGVINAIARNAKDKLTESAKARFNEVFQLPVEKATILGGLEFMDTYPDLSPVAIDYLWQNSPTTKLGGGAYAQALKIDGEPVFLVNGFHPRQLEHFILQGRSIVAFTLCGDLDWKSARNQFIGKTNPADADKGSIRRTLLDLKDIFGLKVVNSSWNGVHLSAGPVEGLLELIRYNSDFTASQTLEIYDFSFGEKLESTFSSEIVRKIISNDTVNFKAEMQSIFDITEEKNADQAISTLMEVFREP